MIVSKRHKKSVSKVKIIVACLLGCFAVVLAWGINNVAFQQVIGAVENMSAPNERLRLVNQLSVKVSQLDQTQKGRLLANRRTSLGFLNETSKLNKLIDTLQSQYNKDNVQVKRLSKLKSLLVERDKLFMSYLKVRETIVNDTSFSAQVQALNNLLDENSRQVDKGVVSTEKKTSTTLIYPDAPAPKDTRSFFSKLFGKKRKEPVEQKEGYKVVELELNVQRDTIAQAIQDSILQSMSAAVERLEEIQHRRNARFIHRENTLVNANNRLIRQIQSILKQVEDEVLIQTAANNREARAIVKTSIEKTGIIMIVFLGVTVILLYLILTDITRSARYRKALEQARDDAEYHSRARQRFLSNMSHEIRTPLQSVLGYAELARSQPEPDKQYVETIYQASRHLVQIVNEVLDYNRIISGKFTYSNHAFNMYNVLEEVAESISLNAKKKQLKFIRNYHFSPESVVNGDPFRLKQILYNLLGNAVKFTNEGEVKFTVSCIANEGVLNYSFIVTDTGLGIAEKDFGKIFNEFERVEIPDAEQRNGTGLGLAISKELVEQQGGHISVESAEGVGSTFTVYLQFTRAEAVQQQSAVPILKTAAAIKLPSVWVVDDDQFILDLCSLILEKDNIEHRCFNSATKLLNTAWNDDVRIVFTDIRMPTLNGKELCARLREVAPADTLIYALTAQALPNEQAAILAAGFDGILTKPFTADDLLDIVASRATTQTSSNTALPDADLDLSALKKMTFGDEQNLAEILSQFNADTRDDIGELENSLTSDTEVEKIVLLTHRLAGRTGQIGARKLALSLRKIENELSEEFLTHDIVLELQALIAELKGLTDYFEEEYSAIERQI